MEKLTRKSGAVYLVAARALSAISCLGLGACGTSGSRTESAVPDSAQVSTAGRDSAAVPDSPSVADSTSPEAAANVVRDYYAAIDARDHLRAYRWWGGEGAASGKTYSQFASGFDSTAHVEASVGPPGRMDAAAGSRYVEVPVTIRAVSLDGEERRYAGRYVLRRSVVDGATAAQRRWHIDSARMSAVR